MTQQPAHCPTPSWSGSSCKKRTCKVCGPRWAANWFRVMTENLEAYGGKVVLVSITAPGADRLPWDEAICGHKGRPGKPHRHAGKRGCRVQQRAAREWTETCSLRWQWLRNAAQMRAKRETGEPANLLERVWELQKRGVPHLHVVLGYSTLPEIRAAKAFVAALAELADRNDYGFVDRKLRPVSGKEAARYLASYLTGRSKHKPELRELVADPMWTYMSSSWVFGKKKPVNLPLVWLTPGLTSTGKKTLSGLPTFVTMRILRRARHLWAASRGFCDAPRWTGTAEALKVGVVFTRCYLKRAGPEVTKEMIDEADALDRKIVFYDRPDWGAAALRYVVEASRPPTLEAAAA